jgi:hypothetical protein
MNKSHFRPESEAEHKRGNMGYDVPDRCAHCRRPFLDHVNGECRYVCELCDRLSKHDEEHRCAECGGCEHCCHGETFKACEEKREA